MFIQVFQGPVADGNDATEDDGRTGWPTSLPARRDGWAARPA